MRRLRCLIGGVCLALLVTSGCGEAAQDFSDGFQCGADDEDEDICLWERDREREGVNVEQATALTLEICEAAETGDPAVVKSLVDGWILTMVDASTANDVLRMDPVLEPGRTLGETIGGGVDAHCPEARPVVEAADPRPEPATSGP